MSSSLNADVIVLGAGIVGTSTALHLQKRGRSVVLIDRRGRRRGDELRQHRHHPARGRGALPVPAQHRAHGAVRPQPAARGQPALERAADDRALALPLLARLHAGRSGGHLARGAAADRALHPGARGADGRGRHPRHDPPHRLSALPPLGRGAGGGDLARTKATSRPMASISDPSTRASWPSWSRTCAAPRSAAC